MNFFVMLALCALYVVLALIGLRFPNVISDWKMDVKATARLLVLVLSSILLFILLWYFLAQQTFPDFMITATYLLFITAAFLFLVALVLKGKALWKT
jgi:hypothetical protein